MSIEFASNPLASKLNTFNLKLQFNCSKFYDEEPLVTCSNPYIPIIGYDVAENSFTFQITISPQNSFSLGGILLSSFVAQAPIVSGSPAPVANDDKGLWWAIIGLSSDGKKAFYKIGAEQTMAGVGKLPDLVFLHFIVNADVRSMQP